MGNLRSTNVVMQRRHEDIDLDGVTSRRRGSLSHHPCNPSRLPINPQTRRSTTLLLLCDQSKYPSETSLPMSSDECSTASPSSLDSHSSTASSTTSTKDLDLIKEEIGNYLEAIWRWLLRHFGCHTQRHESRTISQRSWKGRPTVVRPGRHRYCQD